MDHVNGCYEDDQVVNGRREYFTAIEIRDREQCFKVLEKPATIYKLVNRLQKLQKLEDIEDAAF
jgi:hypothetical protein